MLQPYRLSMPAALWIPILAGVSICSGAIAQSTAGPTSAPPVAAAGISSSILNRAITASRDRLRASQNIWQDHSTWQTAWRVRTEHYEVRRLGSYAQARGTADTLERALVVYEKMLGIQLPASSLPLKVWVHPSLAEYRQFGEDHGEDHSSFYGSFYAAGHPEKIMASYGDRDWVRMWLVHSALHQFLDATFPSRSRPVWLEEGLAAYFSTNYFGNFGWAKSQFYKLRQDDSKFIPLVKLMSDPIQQYGNGNPTERMIELGMAFSYLFHVRDDTRTRSEEVAPFRDYLRLLLEGKDASIHELHELLGTPEALRLLQTELRTEEFDAGQ